MGNFVSFQRPAEDTFEAAEHGNDLHPVFQPVSGQRKEAGTSVLACGKNWGKLHGSAGF